MPDQFRGVVRSFFIYILVLLAFVGLPAASAQGIKKVLNAARPGQPITIDGKLNEAPWQTADKAKGFMQYTPQPGEPSRRETEVSILYDNEAVYIGAMMYDEPDSILRQLSARDDYGDQSTDVFGIFFATYNDDQNATEFAVTAAGVQYDGILKFNGGNSSWNAAWYSRVSFNERGWSAEIRIPYSALRFPKKTVQEWGVNFYRVIRRHRERSYWNTILPTVPNILSQSGVLRGIQDIESPVRLALLPYVSAYAENYDGANANAVNGGLDIKYGLSESFTVDMTLVPDFGQTIYDNKVLNLSPFEVRYNENRYFFTEGLDLFNKNDLFYSRRVGGAPVNGGRITLDSNEVVTRNPATTKLYNATKISGRTRRNLGIGFFNAVSAPAYARIDNSYTSSSRTFQTAPLTNYNVIVLDQVLKNNSFVSFINTNVWRRENSYNADVAALLFKFANKANSYGISGSGDVSQLYKGGKPDVGYRYYLNFGKLNGNYNWSFTARSLSDRFNPNDLGYLDRNNYSYYSAQQYYNIYTPTRYFNSAYNHMGVEYYRIFNPNVFQQFNIYGSHNVTFKNFLTSGFFWSVTPVEGNDYFEPRTFGRFYIYPKNYMIGGFYSSDYRKKFALDLELTNRWFAERQRNALSWSVSPRYRFSNKFSMIYNLNGEHKTDDVGFVDNVSDSIILGVRALNTVTNAVNADYIFTSRMSLSLSARHYWSQAVYAQYTWLGNDGRLNDAPAYTRNRNVNFNTFNVYMSFVWQFRPGSEMTVVYQNSIFSSPQNPPIVTNYFNNLDNTLQAPQSNSLSVKIIYYLDYQGIQKAIRRS